MLTCSCFCNCSKVDICIYIYFRKTFFNCRLLEKKNSVLKKNHKHIHSTGITYLESGQKKNRQTCSNRSLKIDFNISGTRDWVEHWILILTLYSNLINFQFSNRRLEFFFVVITDDISFFFNQTLCKRGKNLRTH